jgi:5-enolpyruvylshikimate-3-phosphate synthase
MAFAVMSMLLKSGGSVNSFEAVTISNPNFLEQVSRIC